jgi:hypothetical protein
MDLTTCPSDDVDPNPGVQLPLTPRPTPEQDGQALPNQQYDDTSHPAQPGRPDPPDRPDLAEPPLPRKKSKDPAPCYGEISADIGRPELILP